MSGGAWEYVAAYVNGENNNLILYGKAVMNGEAKTKNVYSKASSEGSANNYNVNSSKYGDAVYETSTNGNSYNGSWYGDSSGFPSTSRLFFLRGGYYGYGTEAGVFHFIDSDGGSGDAGSFRPVLITL